MTKSIRYAAITIALIVVLIIAFAIVTAISPVHNGNVSNVLPHKTSGNLSIVEDGSESLLADGEVSEKIQEVPEGYTAVGGSDGVAFSQVREQPTGNYILMGDVNVGSLDTATNFSGILDGNGYTITINGTHRNTGDSLSAGGLFHTLSGTVKNVKINVQTFVFGVGSTGTHYAGMIAAVMDSGTISNVSVSLNHSPVNSVNSAECDFYMHAYAKLGNDNWLILGGLAGVTKGSSEISYVTVSNNTSDYGFSVRGWVEGGIFTKNADNLVIGGFVGKIGEADGDSLNLDAITLSGNADSKVMIINAANPGNVYSGGLAGWCYRGSCTLKGMIYDYPAELDVNIISENCNNKKVGLLTGVWDNVTADYKGIYFNSQKAPSEIKWIYGHDENMAGLIVYNNTDLSFDKANKGNVIVKGAHTGVIGEKDLIFGFGQGGMQPLYDVLLVNDVSEKKENVSVSFPVSEYSVGSGQANTEGGFVTAYYGTAEFAEQNNIQQISEETQTYWLSERIYNNQDLKIYLDTYNSENPGTKVSTLDYVYVSETQSKGVGLHNMILNMEKVFTVGSGENIGYYIADDTAGGFVQFENINDIVKIQVSPKDVNVTLNGNFEVVYGNELNSIISQVGQSAVFEGGYEDFKGIDSCTLTATSTAEGLQTEYTPQSGAGETFVITVTSSDPNYVVTTNGTPGLTVVKRSVTGSIELPDGAVYNGSAFNASFRAFGNSIVNGDELVYNFVYTPVTEGVELVNGMAVNAGEYSVTVDLSSDPNYTFAEQDVTLSGTFTVDKADVIWDSSLANQFGYYNGREHVTKYAVKGVISDDDAIINADGMITGALSSGGESMVNVGTYTYVYTFAGSPNYKSSQFTVTYTINKIQIYLDVKFKDGTSSLSVIYGSDAVIDNSALTFNNIPVEVTVRVLQGEDAQFDPSVVEITLVTDLTNTSGVGNYKLQATANGGENYDVMGGSFITLTVIPKEAPISVKGDAVLTRPYDGMVTTAEELAALFENVSGAPLSVVIRDAEGKEVDSVKDAGVYTVTAVYTDTNYSGSGQLTYTVTASDKKVNVESYRVSYNALYFVFTDGTDGVQYSTDGGKTWRNVLSSGTVPVDMNGSWTIAFRYAPSEGLSGESVTEVTVKATFEAIEQYMDNSFGDSFYYDDIAKFDNVKQWASVAEGEKSETYDVKYNALQTEYDALKAETQAAVKDALDTGGRITGTNPATAAAAAATATAGAAAVLCVGLIAVKKYGKGGKNNEKE